MLGLGDAQVVAQRDALLDAVAEGVLFSRTAIRDDHLTLVVHTRSATELYETTHVDVVGGLVVVP